MPLWYSHFHTHTHTHTHTKGNITASGGFSLVSLAADNLSYSGESIPIRLFLSGYVLAPTMRDINKKFSVKYYLNLVLVDEEERRYFKQQVSKQRSEFGGWWQVKVYRVSDRSGQWPGVSDSVEGQELWGILMGQRSEGWWQVKSPIGQRVSNRSKVMRSKIVVVLRWMPVTDVKMSNLDQGLRTHRVIEV